MIGHQREILAQLGIDIWVSRDTLCQEIEQSSIWRDQALSEIITKLESIPPIVTKTVVVKEQQPIIKKEIKQPVIIPDQSLQLEERPQLEIGAFSLQALVLPHLIIILNSTAIDAAQQQLWANIQRAIHADFFELHWPFALPNMNDGHGVENYIQGFIDAISSEKQILSLGPIPHWNNSKLMQLAGLQEMLDTPLLKRRLWNFIQNRQDPAG